MATAGRPHPQPKGELTHNSNTPADNPSNPSNPVNPVNPSSVSCAQCRSRKLRVSLYFRNIHGGAPMLHQASYTAGLRLPPHMRPPMCLQYIVMASAAATSETYRHLSEPFYQRSRAYAEVDELRGQETFAAGTTNEPPIPLCKGLQQLEQGQDAQPSPLAIRILAANELLHALDNNPRHFFEVDNGDEIPNGPYWVRHRQIDMNLTTLTMLLPERLHLHRAPRTLDAILVHASTNMATIHLHRTALALLHELQTRSPKDASHQLLIAQGQTRLLPATEGILAVFRAAGDGVGTAIRNPFLSFAAYLAALVFLEDHFREAAGEEGRPREGPLGRSEEKLRYLAQTLVFFGRRARLCGPSRSSWRRI
ncbi:hypothetical protein CHGG_00039 [Chaetomium globosum CBS 148.51]|uniref:Transcription factor domain-containing protein n=1 Tax=Chaetomium globosum (strain ATCC 6205 / CBS 148.51 / DSM 1962 / NBRC 6347 / NRRL 1970) TaxID=306901 RepID=Q2HIB5_CHAGB|nr:uncharacterized protein CHGG_00039 [Chaetomium globosum CBS 148.51]EAQ91804.1 hypothetical protein CHGG_00039 [Chaetomium globosum CBS 148.51]